MCKSRCPFLISSLVLVALTACESPSEPALAVEQPVTVSLAFDREPNDAESNQSLGAVRVVARLSTGLTDRTFSGSVTVSLGDLTGSGGRLEGTATARAVTGVAVFDGLEITERGLYELHAESPGLPPALSRTFSIREPCFQEDGCSRLSLPSQLLFSSCREWDWEATPIETCKVGGIAMLSPGGGEEVVYSHGALIDQDIAWSPDGLRIALSRPQSCPPSGACQSDLYVMNANGTGLTRLTTTNFAVYGPAWSPDGRSIAFDSWDPSLRRSSMMVVNADGTSLHSLGDLDGGSPAWSPDGTRIAFSSTGDDGRWSIYVANTDGSGKTRVTTPTDFPPYLGSDYGPAWSPDGRRIAFGRIWIDHGTFSSCQIFLVDPSGANSFQVTNDRYCAGKPAWSPDGRMIAYQGTDAVTSFPGIMLVNADGSSPTLLRYVGTDFPRVAWRPLPR